MIKTDIFYVIITAEIYKRRKFETTLNFSKTANSFPPQKPNFPTTYIHNTGRKREQVGFFHKLNFNIEKNRRKSYETWYTDLTHNSILKCLLKIS